MASQSPGAKLRETIAGVVAIGAAVSGEAEKLKAEAAARAKAAQEEVGGNVGGAGVSGGA